MPNDGGPAFPALFGGEAFKPGMTLRDYFAAQAMQSIVSVLNKGIRAPDIPLMVQDAYAIADAMLAQRERK